MGMFQYLISEPLQYRRASLGWFRFWQMLADRTNGAFDMAYRKLARVWQPIVALPPSDLLGPSEIASVVETLHRDGYAGLPYMLSANDLAEIKRFCSQRPPLDRI